MDMSAYNIYLGKSVQLSKTDSSVLRGTLSDIEENGVFVDNTFVAAEEIDDLRYVGTLDADDYEPKRNTLYTPEMFAVSEESLATLFGPNYAFGEFAADYTAHLVLNEIDSIQLTDIEVLRRYKTYHPDVLATGAFLYRFHDGDWFFAYYTVDGEEAYLAASEGRYLFDAEKLADITTLPVAGDTVTVLLKDEREFTSIVSAADERGLALIEGPAGRIAYRDIVSIRRTALCSRRDQKYFFGGFPARLRYFRDRNLIRYKTGISASFFVAMTSSGLTAKDIVPLQETPNKTITHVYGVLTNYMTFAEYGYVSPDYHLGDVNTGTYRIVRRSITGVENPDELDTHRYVYTVRMSVEEEKEVRPYKRARRVEILEQYAKKDYLAIAIDNEGNVTTELNPDGALQEDTVREGYGFLFLYDPRYSFGYIADSFKGDRTEKTFTVKPPATKPLQFQGKQVDTRRFVYLVKHRYDTANQPPLENGKLVPVVYGMQILRALPIGASYDVTEDGTLIEQGRFAPTEALVGHRVAVSDVADKSYTFGRLSSLAADHLSLVDNSGNAVTIPYDQIGFIYGFGTVTRFISPTDFACGFGFIDVGTGLYFRETDLLSDQSPKIKAGDAVCFTVAAGEDGRPVARQVRPLPSTSEIGYVIGKSADGLYHVLDEQSYRTTPRAQATPVLHPALIAPEFLANSENDYKVRIVHQSFIDGTALREGISEVLEVLPKLHFGRLDHFFADRVGSYCQGILVPYDIPGIPKVYFHRRLNPILENMTVDPKKSYGTVSFIYHPSEAEGRLPTAENMQILGTTQPVKQPEKPPVKSMPAEDPAVSFDIDGIISYCLQYNQSERALAQLKEYQATNSLSVREYELKRLRILEKMVKDAKDDLEAASAARREMIDCIRAIRSTFSDNDEQYGLRLKLIIDQARLLVKEGRSQEAVEQYQAWDTLLREFLTIYPSAAPSYEKIRAHVQRMLKALTNDGTDLSDDEPLDDTAMASDDVHPYILWRQKQNAAWKTAPFDCAFAELNNSDRTLYAQKVQFLSFLLLENNSQDTRIDLAEFFGEKHRYLALFGKKSLHSQRESTRCSAFATDSVLLHAYTARDRQQWVHLFDEHPRLIERYCRDLSYLLACEAPTEPTLETLNMLFESAIQFVKEAASDTQEMISLRQYAGNLLAKLTVYQKRCGIDTPTLLLDAATILQQYEQRVGFSGRLDCLRTAAKKLSDYQKLILQTPSIHDWYIFWPLGRQLLRQIFNSWERLCQISRPSITFGTPTGKKVDGNWHITVPVRNEVNKAPAERFVLSVVVDGKGYKAKDQQTIEASGRDVAYELVFPVRDDSVQQLTLELKATYHYVSGVKVTDTDSREQKTEQSVTHSCTVADLSGERVELSKAVIDMIGKDAKATINTATEAGRTVREILKNREEEVKEIIERLTYVDDNGNRHLYTDGRWIALYGQWRVGKTVLLYEVFRVLRGEEFSAEALPAQATFSGKDDFEADTVNKIRTAIEAEMEFGSEEEERWWSLYEGYEKRYGKVTTLLALGRILQRYHQQPGARRIVLALDEFTQIYTALKRKNTTTGFLRDFVEFISLSGCVILTAGGEHTVELMENYDINMMQKADQTLLVRYLSYESTASYVEKVISEPSYLGNPEQKKRTIDRIYRLTQGNVFLLLKFCDALIDYILGNESIRFIDDLTINQALDKIIRDAGDRPEGVMNDYFNSLFNPYNEEAEEDLQDGFEHVRTVNRKLLECIVRYAYQDSRICQKDQLRSALEEDHPEWEDALATLCRRGVVKDDGFKNISIPIDLFYELQARIIRKDVTNESFV